MPLITDYADIRSRMLGDLKKPHEVDTRPPCEVCNNTGWVELKLMFGSQMAECAVCKNPRKLPKP